MGQGEGMECGGWGVGVVERRGEGASGPGCQPARSAPRREERGEGGPGPSVRVAEPAGPQGPAVQNSSSRASGPSESIRRCGPVG